MWILYNVTFPDGYYDGHEYVTPIAKFTSKELAKQYVDKSIISKEGKYTPKCKFLKSSLFWGDSYKIEEEPDLPVDPPVSDLVQNKEYLVKVTMRNGTPMTILCKGFEDAQKERNIYHVSDTVLSSEIIEVVV